MSDALGSNAAEMLRSYARRIVRLEDEKEQAKIDYLDPLSEDIKEVKAEAKAQGFDAKLLGQAIKRYRMDPDVRAELELYEAAVLADILGPDPGETDAALE
jgi:uncharacterized protein (UPF0335 family)